MQMSGSMAGNTYARNRSGNYVRARTKPVNPNTARQVAVRSSLTYLTERWSETLTDDQRIAWNLYAASVTMKNRVAEDIKLTGFNHYLRSNTHLVVMGHGNIIVDDGPTVFELPEKDPTLAVTATETPQALTITYDNTLPWALEDPAFIWFFQGSPQNAQRNFFAGPHRNVGGIVGIIGGGAVTPAVVTPAFAIAEGQRQWIYARILRNDGRLSEKFFANCFVAA